MQSLKGFDEKVLLKWRSLNLSLVSICLWSLFFPLTKILWKYTTASTYTFLMIFKVFLLLHGQVFLNVQCLFIKFPIYYTLRCVLHVDEKLFSLRRQFDIKFWQIKMKEFMIKSWKSWNIILEKLLIRRVSLFIRTYDWV